MDKRQRLRPAVRAVVTDPDRRIVLVHFAFIEPDQPRGLWACPGGGIDPGESIGHALRRELREELGLRVADIGQPIWWKEDVFPMAEWDGQRDTYYWIEVEAFDPHPEFTTAELRAENVDVVRWWTYDEVQAAQAAYDRGDLGDPAHAVLSPRRLGHLLAELFSDGRPPSLRRLAPR